MLLIKEIIQMKNSLENNPQYASFLSINKLVQKVRLGISKEERSIPQEISLDLRLYLPNALSSFNDDNGEYVCYNNISEKVVALCKAKEYRLIEFLGLEIYRMIRTETKSEIKIWLTLNKTKILLDYVEGGTSFTYTDLPYGSWVAPI